jgi:hypothetical protein
MVDEQLDARALRGQRPLARVDEPFQGVAIVQSSMFVFLVFSGHVSTGDAARRRGRAELTHTR